MKSKSDESPIPDVGVNRFAEMRAGYGPQSLVERGGEVASRRGFTNHCNYRLPKGRSKWLPSMTVPDMSPSLRDMLNRHLNGGSVKVFNAVNVPVGSRIPQNLEMMDAIERAELAEQNADFIATTRGQMQTARAAREQAALLEKATAAAHARILAGNSAPPG